MGKTVTFICSRLACHLMTKDWKRILKKTWRFIWEDDSWESWVVNVILAFVLIKFIVYPALGFMLGTSFPIVAVVSGSMEHEQGNFDDWWVQQSCCSSSCQRKEVQGQLYESINLSKNQFKSFDYSNGFNTGDIMLLRNADEVNVGEIIVFWSPTSSDPIIHRVVKKDMETGTYTTKGDHNCWIDPHETGIEQERVLGKALLRIPLLGYVKLGFVKLINLIW